LPTLHRLSQRRIPALIAFLAIMLLFIAPWVSRTLEHRQIAQEGTAAEMVMPGMNMAPAHHGMPDDGDRSAMHQAPAMSEGMGTMDDIACGYCQLLVHFPVLIWLVLAVILLLFTVSRPRLVRYVPIAPVRLFPGVSQPRAPPVC